MANIVTSRSRSRRFRAPAGPWRLALGDPLLRNIESAFLAGPSYALALAPNRTRLDTPTSSTNIVLTGRPVGWTARRLNANSLTGDLAPSVTAASSGWNGDGTLFFVVWRNGTVGSNNRTVFTLRDASGPVFQWKDANGTISGQTYYNTSAGFTTTGATDTDTAHTNQLLTIAFRSRWNGASYDQSVWLNGVQDATASRTQAFRTFSSSVGGTHTWGVPDNTGGAVFGSDAFEIGGGAFFSEALSDAVLLEAHANPWFWLEPDVVRVFVPAAGGGITTGTGSSAGVATASGEGQALATSTATIAGVATVTGVAGGTVTADGSAAGIATAAGEGQALATSTATIAGVATVSGVGFSGSIATIAGVATASGEGQSLATSTGAAAGSATAAGVGEGGAAVSVPAGGGSSMRRRQRRRVMIGGDIYTVSSPQELQQLLEDYDARLRVELEEAREEERPVAAIQRRIKVVERRIERVEQEVIDWRKERRKRDEEVLLVWSLTR